MGPRLEAAKTNCGWKPQPLSRHPLPRISELQPEGRIGFFRADGGLAVVVEFELGARRQPADEREAQSRPGMKDELLIDDMGCQAGVEPANLTTTMKKPNSDTIERFETITERLLRPSTSTLRRTLAHCSMFMYTHPFLSAYRFYSDLFPYRFYPGVHNREYCAHIAELNGCLDVC